MNNRIPNLKISQLTSNHPQTHYKHHNDPINKTIIKANNKQLATILQQEITSLKSIIRHSEHTLQHSHRQETSKSKLVHSDYMDLSFRYSTQKMYDSLHNKRRKMPEDFEIDQGNEESPIRLPQQNAKHELSPSGGHSLTQRSINQILSPRNRYFQEANQQARAATHRGIIKGNNLQNNKHVIPSIINQINYKQSPSPYASNKGYRLTFQKQKIFYSKDKLYQADNPKQVKGYKQSMMTNEEMNKNKGLIGLITRNDKKLVSHSRNAMKSNKLHFNNSLQLLNKSAETTYPNRNITKFTTTTPHQPTTNHKSKITTTHQSSNRLAKVNEGKDMAKLKDLAKHRDVSKGWQQLKVKVDKYQFVRKILSQTDIFNIYEYLRRNHIRQQKWPIFVVEEAYKKMASNQYK